MQTDESRTVDLRSRLLEAAQQVFAVSGYASATVDDIISAASTSRATFYRYFRSKKDLFDELSRSCFLEMRTMTKELAAFDPQADGRDGLEQLVAAYADMQQRQRGVVRAWLEKADRPESAVRKEAANTFHALLRGLEDRIQSVGTPSDVDPEVQAALLLILLNRATFYVLHRHSRIDAHDLTPTLATMIHRAYFGAGTERRSRRRLTEPMARKSVPPTGGQAGAGEPKWSQTVLQRSTRAHGRRTLVKLLDAAEAEFAANGWHGARMARLAKRAGTAHGTVYAYFADKDDLLFALWEDVGSEFNTRLKSMPSLGAGSKRFSALREWAAEVCACFRRHAAVFHTVSEALADEENLRGGKAALRDQRQVLSVFEARIREAGVTGLDPAMAALCLYAILEGANESMYRGELLVTEDELVVGVSEFIQMSLFGAEQASRLTEPGRAGSSP